MILFRDLADVPADFGPAVVAIGKFDGVHSGHRAVLEQAMRDAEPGGARVVAVTFDRNPLSLLRPELCPESLIGVTQKIGLLAESGIDATLMLTFDQALANLTAEEFVQRVLVEALHAQTVLVGEDFRFGRGGRGTPALLAELGAGLGFEVDVVGDIQSVEGDRRVSSTWIRELLQSGDVVGAAALLGRPHAVRGAIVHGLKRGRELGFPTANLATDVEGFVPADGVYAGWLVDEQSGTRHPSAISVGTNPTFDDVPVRQVEAYVLDRSDLDLYDRVVSVEFVDRIRGMVAFQGLGPLIEQMTDDVVKAREVLACPSPVTDQ